MDLIPSNAPHWHLLLNHFPSIGTVIALALLLTSLYLKSEELKRTSLVLFVLMALCAIPTYITGAATGWAIGGVDGISMDMIAVHQDAALLAFTTMGLTGCFSWLALWQYRRFSGALNWNIWVVLVLAILSVGFMTQTGSLGGDINHPEIRLGEEMIAGSAEMGRTAAIRAMLNQTAWLWPALEAAHFLGMAILFGVVLLVSLRVLGVARSLSFAAVHRLLPLGVLGLLINVVTGMLFFIGDSGRYVEIDAFFWKMALIVIGGVAALYFTMFDRPWSLRGGDNAALATKVMAAGTILLWTGVLLLGRFLPYLEGG